ncbi:MAG: ankyrin repeat domain-containing protein [Alphaproteobacteria bacterium]|nr:ankyrin repeat domain-containing protein [Alphaproteobacteria bacterium]
MASRLNKVKLKLINSAVIALSFTMIALCFSSNACLAKEEFSKDQKELMRITHVSLLNLADNNQIVDFKAKIETTLHNNNFSNDMKQKLIDGLFSAISCCRSIEGHTTIEYLEFLLSKGANIQNLDKTKEEKARGLGMYIYGDTEVLEFLIKLGLDPNGLTNIEEETTAFMMAALKRRIDMCDLLLRYGADINRVDFDGNNALIYALLDDVHEDHTDPYFVDVTNKMVSYLISKGVNVHKKNNKGKTPYIIALEFQHRKAAALIKAAMKNSQRTNQ